MNINVIIGAIILVTVLIPLSAILFGLYSIDWLTCKCDKYSTQEQEK